MTTRLQAILFAAVMGLSAQAVADPSAPSLRSVQSVKGGHDRASRSRAYFREAGKVILGPRCMNCHPADRFPTQGDRMQPHIPRVNAGDDGLGSGAMACAACHQAHNIPVWGATVQSVPGAQPWMLAPASMAWQGRSLGRICRLFKDRSRNGDKDLRAIREHSADENLVGWAWRPGDGRRPAPGTQKAFVALITAWIATGAACPAD